MDKELDNIINENHINKINEKLFLTNKQIKTLENHNIPFKKCQNYKELIFILQDLNDDEELDEILNEISELDYYYNTKK